ncbi:MAG TPA: type IV pilin N-terminal domain-containing protein [Methanocorpusculum sp.]|nr:type IV pilin N-terminal domain-containing protein [Methanocorpusculum sp.]
MSSAIQRKTNRKDDAMSPVIGASLMTAMAVTLVSVVAVFAGNAMGSVDPAPVSVLDITASADNIMIHHMSGNELDGSLMKVIICNPDGTNVLSSGPLSVAGVGKFSVGQTIDITNNIGDGKKLSQYLIPGREIRVQVLYDENYKIADKTLVVKNGSGNGGIEYLQLTIDANTWYKTETDAINAYTGNKSVQTPKAIGAKEIQVKKDAVITVTRSGATDDYTVSPAIINTIKLSFNGQDVAWAVVNSAAYTGEETTFSPRDTVSFNGANSNITLNFEKTGEETLAAANGFKEAMTVSLN